MRGCHDDRRAGGGGCVEKRSALSLVAALGSGGAGGNTAFASASPPVGPGMGFRDPSPYAGVQGSGPRIATQH